VSVIWVDSGRFGAPVYDPNTLLLISGRGANGSAPIDSSQYSNVIGVGGNAAITTSVADPFGASQGVIGYDGNGDFILFPNVSTFNSNTIHSLEFFYRRVSGNAMLYQRAGSVGDWNGTNGVEMLIYISGNVFDMPFNNGTSAPTSITINGGAALAANTWIHCLESYNGATTRLFINGSLVGSSSAARAIPSSVSAPRMGDYSLASGLSMNGQLAQVRWRNVAVIANFTPPPAPFTP
jgi:hypothetical protein